MIFKSNDDLKKYIRTLIKSLELIGEIKLVENLRTWDVEFFTTSSELLGELVIILKKIKALKSLDKTTKNEVKETIETINKVLGF